MEIPEHIHDLQGLLTYVDSTKDGFRPMEMESAIRVVLQRIPGQPVDGQHDWYNEVAASSMMLLQEDGGPWGMAYGPIMEGTDAAGNPVKRGVDPPVLQHLAPAFDVPNDSQEPFLKLGRQA